MSNGARSLSMQRDQRQNERRRESVTMWLLPMIRGENVALSMILGVAMIEFLR